MAMIGQLSMLNYFGTLKYIPSLDSESIYLTANNLFLLDSNLSPGQIAENIAAVVQSLKSRFVVFTTMLTL